MPRLKPQEKREILARRKAEIEAQLRALDAKAKETTRKDDTRRKVIAGALVLEDMAKNPNDPLAARLLHLLNQYVEPRSRHLFPFLPALQDAAPKPPPTEAAPTPFLMAATGGQDGGG